MENSIKNYIPNNDNRALTEDEINTLIDNGNLAQSWSYIRVSNSFNPRLIKNCRFYGSVYVGSPNESILDLDGVIIPEGISDSTFSNCVILKNSNIFKVGLIANYIIENNVIISNSSEITSNHFASFGCGYIPNNISINHRIALVNENGGRSAIPFKNINSSDAYLFIKYGYKKDFSNRIKKITESTIERDYKPIGVIGAYSKIFNSKCIRNSNIGRATIIDGAEIIDNSTILSDIDEQTKIKAGVQITNSIVGYGNDLRSSCQLQSVITGTAVSISQTARITESFVGDNSAISCCEIAHSFLFPSHGQHHNNSFLIASLIGGQSNIAAGATIGSNHNSRVNDGELWASRGFWPGLCTSFKHNSKFASFIMCSKADYPSELNIPYPFSLISTDMSSNSLVIYPAYWILNNLYALMRSRYKFVSRDKRVHKNQIIEHSPIAPDTIEEIFKALKLLELHTGTYWYSTQNEKNLSENDYISKGRQLLSEEKYNQPVEIESYTLEKSNRKVTLRKPSQAWKAYRDIIKWYASIKIISSKFEDIIASLENHANSIETQWINVGGQIMRKCDMTELINDITTDNSITYWDDIHKRLELYNNKYNDYALNYAINAIFFICAPNEKSRTPKDLANILDDCEPILREINKETKNSRKKDFRDPFRSIVYDSKEESLAVLGSVEEDSVIIKFERETIEALERIKLLSEKLKSKV